MGTLPVMSATWRRHRPAYRKMLGRDASRGYCFRVAVGSALPNDSTPRVQSNLRLDSLFAINMERESYS
jgi:hypothetical protein